MVKLSIRGIAVFSVALLAVFPAAAKVTPPHLEVETYALANGLEVALLEDHSAPVVNMQVWYHVGSKDERPGRSGFAHLFEHMMFKGSDNVEAGAHSEYIQSIGGRYNASTFFDYTFYWQTFPSNYLERLLFMEADRMRSLKVTEESFTSEREVVKEERRLRVENPPFGRLAEVVLGAVYTRHPYRIHPIGTMADLDAATIEDVRAFHALYYVPNNATLILSGDFNSDQARRWIDKHFGSIARGKPIPRDIPSEPEQSAERRLVDYHSTTPLPAVVMVYPLPPDGHPDIYALNIVGNLLSNGQSSRLYRKLVYEEQLAIEASGEVFALEDPGIFFFFAILNQGRTPQEGEAALIAEIGRLKNEPVSDEELTKARNQFVSRLVFGRQTVQEKASAIGHAAVTLDDAARVNHELAEYQKVTAADLQRVARKYLTEQRRTVVQMFPEALRPASEAGGEESEEAAR